MPIYEYRCADCGHTFEEIQQFSDPDPETCPSCEAKAVKRLLSRTNFQLKGGGWFADDYSGGATTAPSTSTSESGTKEPAASPASTESVD